MDSKERMKCADAWFIGGGKFSLEEKERLICVWDDLARLEQDTNSICWYFKFPPREWALEIAEPNYPFVITYNTWFLENNREEFMKWFERLEKRLDSYKNTIPSEWKVYSSDVELNSEEIEKWYNIFINSSEYRFAKGVYKFMMEKSD